MLLDWSSPDDVFPILTEVLTLPSYRRTIFEGLLQSLGAMTSSMVCASVCVVLGGCVCVAVQTTLWIKCCCAHVVLCIHVLGK